MKILNHLIEKVIKILIRFYAIYFNKKDKKIFWQYGKLSLFKRLRMNDIT